MGFSTNGLLSTFDSTNIIRILNPDWQGWLEVLNLSAALKDPPGVSFYLQAVTERGVLYYPCKNLKSIPPIVPRPVMDIKDFSVDFEQQSEFFDSEQKFVV